jgi:drug/metabolite transporter (DMT)-like permease
MGIPVFSAINWTLLQRGGQDLDFSAAVLIGGLISCLVMLPLAWPFTANAHDLALLTLLGVVQLGVPCVLAVRAARGLASHETSLLALLEVIFGIVWTVLFAGERPGITTLIGGAMVLAALAWQSLHSARERNAMSPGAVA